jgi:hypothetical protein
MGIAISVPVSRKPRKLSSVISKSSNNAMPTRCGHKIGNADAIAATPAVRLTAAVSR